MAHRRKGNVRMVIKEHNKTLSGGEYTGSGPRLVTHTYYKKQKGPKPAGIRSERRARSRKREARGEAGVDGRSVMGVKSDCCGEV